MKPKIRKTLSGKVVKNKMDKTVTVVVENKFKHPLYGKFIVKSTKYHVHDETNESSLQDLVSS
jgi:small subunit ribosomal protein S17